MRRNRTITVKLSEDEFKKLKECANEEHMKVASFVRYAVFKFISGNRKGDKAGAVDNPRHSE